MSTVQRPGGGRLEGKVVLISGTGGGQGRAAALRFAAEGARVMGGDLKQEDEETVRMVREAGGEMHSMHPVDFADRTAVDAWVAAAVERFGGIDVLYNNASAPRFASVATMTAEEWAFTLRNELDVVFHPTQAVWPHLVERGGGSIVNTASTQGINALRATPGGFAHATTKHGVLGFTREVANEGGPHGIRVNAVSPGLIESPATAMLMDIPGFVDAYLAGQIIPRLGQPDDVVNAALFLASDEASFITGQNVVVDGGYTAV